MSYHREIDSYISYYRLTLLIFLSDLIQDTVRDEIAAQVGEPAAPPNEDANTLSQLRQDTVQEQNTGDVPQTTATPIQIGNVPQLATTPLEKETQTSRGKIDKVSKYCCCYVLLLFCCCCVHLIWNYM